jgi:hypothetical protein
MTPKRPRERRDRSTLQGPGFPDQANRSAPAWVNFTEMSDSCRISHPLLIAPAQMRGFSFTCAYRPRESWELLIGAAHGFEQSCSGMAY